MKGWGEENILFLCIAPSLIDAFFLDISLHLLWKKMKKEAVKK